MQFFDAQPLADRMRPGSLDEVLGQDHLVGEGRVLRRMCDQKKVHSMVFWGPPGCGKTSLAELIAQAVNMNVLKISAVLSGIADIRKAIESAQQPLSQRQGTLLFVDEVHRFNKIQQDAFLPHMENGTITLIGATTENPSFELNNALLSRSRVYLLKPITSEEIIKLLQRALEDTRRGLGDLKLLADQDVLNRIADAADGDARRALNILEMSADLAECEIDANCVSQAVGSPQRRFDKGADHFYQQMSAVHKSVRSSDPDAALYWCTRMLDGGCDPLYIARRLVRIASEDIGNADPRSLQLCLAAWDSFVRLGSPEGELAIIQAAIYLACAPKSNAVYLAFKQAKQCVEESGSLDVPMHLRNASTRLMKKMGYGKGYQYDHDADEGIAFDQHCLPEALQSREFYQPKEQGLEIRISEKLRSIREKRKR